tara:strand:+ start:240 stop:1340 length:1101 start_codon:yes stop_codon:yes gene_type:complete
MAKFLNKKEQVIDFKLTSYGNYLLSTGGFNPTYYAFLDDNILYDGQYASAYYIKAAGDPATLKAPLHFERQNDIHERIKDNTSYLEGQVLFEDVEEQPNLAGTGMPGLVEDYLWSDSGKAFEGGEAYFQADITPTKMIPRKDAYKMQAIIGDAFLDGAGEKAPAWKTVMLQGEISSSSLIDGKNKIEIPQLNINLNYIKRVLENPDVAANPQSARQIESVTVPFVDGKVLGLETENAMIYLEEVNTEILNENFDIEVFEIISGSKENTYQRKYFEQEKPQVVNQYMVSETIAAPAPYYLLTTSSVEYYFEALTDRQIDREVACRASNTINKQSYYIDLDFECQTDDGEDIFYDIYGKVTEPEICQT